MAEIHVEADAVSATATALLALADSVDDVQFTHGPTGAMFVVPLALAEKLMEASANDKDEDETPESPKEPESAGAHPAPKASATEPRRPAIQRPTPARKTDSE